MRKNLSCCEYFENEIENKFLAKLGINKDEINNPNIGATAKALNDAGAVTSICLGLGVGITIAISVGSFGIGSIVGATVATVTFTVTKVDKKMKKSKAAKLDKKVEIYFHSHLKCIIMDVAKELSRIFEYQVLALEDGTQIDILAECAVDLMLDLKRDDTFDRNTLLKKVLHDGKVEKRELLTRNGDKWFAPDVFRKPGLQRTIVGTDRAEFIYQVKPNDACDTRMYGYRGQFLETKDYAKKMKKRQNKENETVQVIRFRKTPATDEKHTCEDQELCKECFYIYENCSSGQYFAESAIDSKYTESRDELFTYHPIHILVQCPKVLDSFIGRQLQDEKPRQLQDKNPSLANFLRNKLDLPEHHLVHPVYRPHSPGKVPDLKNADLTGSDFSHSDFRDSSLEQCVFVNCVMLFANLAGAKVSGSKFVDTLISHSNLEKVKANCCEWTKTSLLYSRVDDAYMDSVEPSIGGNCLDGTNICDAITGKLRELNCNERKYRFFEHRRNNILNPETEEWTGFQV
jgi:hypothetical protein